MNVVTSRICAKALAACCLGLVGMVVHATEVQKAKPTPSKPDSSVVEFLLAAASKDFALPGSPHPVGIRMARVGRLADGSGNYTYLLCGKFSPGVKQGTKEWIPFATIKTGDYEQWLGGPATSYCRQQEIKWYEGDQSGALLKRIREPAELRKSAL